IVLMVGNDIWGIDFDACRDPETGEFTAWGAEWLELVGPHTYTELSQSGSGFKAYFRGTTPELPRNVYELEGERIPAKRPQIEVYVKDRYFETTGNKLHGSPDDIKEAPTKLLKRLQQLAKTEKKRRPKKSDKSQEGRNGALFSLGCRMQHLGVSD